MRNQAGWQRIVAERAAAEVRRQAADIGKRVDFDAQQIEFGAVGGDNLERDAAEAQKAHRVGRVDEGRLDLVEIGLPRCRGLLPGAVRRLPLRHRALGRAIVSGTAVVVMMVVTVIVAVAMIVVMVVIVAMVGVAVLASPARRMG